ncbi:MAG: hypothetical protein ABSD85_10720 [Acidimicrobiales bacterium]
MQLVVQVGTWMVHAGGVPELAVGDEWTTRVDFSTQEPLVPAAECAVLGLTPEVVSDQPTLFPGPWYSIVARLRHRRIADRDTVALEVPDLLLGYPSTNHPLPTAPLVAGRGTISVDPYETTSTAFFDESLRTWLVEAIRLVTVPRPWSHPDWTRRREVPLQRTHSHQDDHGGGYVTYFISLRLLTR